MQSDNDNDDNNDNDNDMLVHARFEDLPVELQEEIRKHQEEQFIHKVNPFYGAPSEQTPPTAPSKYSYVPFAVGGSIQGGPSTEMFRYNADGSFSIDWLVVEQAAALDQQSMAIRPDAHQWRCMALLLHALRNAGGAHLIKQCSFNEANKIAEKAYQMLKLLNTDVGGATKQ